MKWKLLILTAFFSSFCLAADPLKIKFDPPDSTHPLGIWHLSDPGLVTKDNPSGWDFGGVVGWQDKYIDRALPVLKRMNAQGVMVCDIEGSSLGSAVQYVGCPDVAKSLNPTFDYKHFFTRLTENGLTYGLTVRGNQEIIDGKPVFPTDQYQSLRRRIAYARNEFGVKWIYIDSNIRQSLPDVPNAWVEGWLIPDTIWPRLAAEFPDVRFIPEHKAPTTHLWTIPYHALNLGSVDIGQHVIREIPNAIGYINCSAVPVDKLRDKIPLLKMSVRAGNILAIDAWFDSDESRAFAEIFK